ncbi:surfeit locus protein 5 subunit 22 of mediator complex domain-containing protein [Hirsutella rhossiliensis]|uniref:Surfeit locus protein 5 subunit 22 of mediator complex domain-containing protein n=1 Tax=Hirsutella rhossiliensis TaxID=111463 RepID=A0A9P8N3B8_9HYPO|nr:surfeit locus protein 5 subunit 22 of mediator complex domain-containing protein [Hirsutella rhossiliensis]KAH0966054.1 surfeit locus protein 5 subunit 22 of mediator complex domain-containing protein [Hirsutella rhossiliensis]
MDRSQPASSNLMDIHNRLIADVLTRYRTLMMLATVQAEGERNNATPETMAVAGISMKMEFDGLYSSIKELLALSRRIKELWVFGPLGKGDPDHQAREAQLDRDVAQVSSLLNGIEAADMKALAERHGGVWARLSKDTPELPPTSATAATGHGGR